MRREVYELLEAINRADSLAQVYESAMQFICSALQCSRVAILLLDDSGVMRFITSRGLSENYRMAVEGHSPWPAEATDPQPVCIPDIDAAALEASVQQKVRKEEIRALAFTRSAALSYGCTSLFTRSGCKMTTGLGDVT